MKRTYTIIFHSGRKVRVRAHKMEVTRYNSGDWRLDYEGAPIHKLDLKHVAAVLKGRH